MPRVPRSRRRPHGLAVSVLALRPLAPMPFCELAAALHVRLSEMRRADVLERQPIVGRVFQVQLPTLLGRELENANYRTLTPGENLPKCTNEWVPFCCGPIWIEQVFPVNSPSANPSL